jgi:AcrR family transcriptional regulator
LEDNEIKERILNKASEMFEQFGFSKVTMEEIAAELGMSKKTLYKFFEGKEQLLKNIVSVRRCAFEDYIIKLWGNNALSFLEKLKMLMNYISKNNYVFRGPLAHDLQKNFPLIWEEINESKRIHSQDKFSLLIREGIEKGVFRKDIDQQILFLIFMSALQGAANPEVLLQLPVTGSQVFEAVVKVLLEGVFTEEGRDNYMSIKHEEHIV